VRFVNRDGTTRTVAAEYSGLEGLAWTPDGSTILYSGADAGLEGYQLLAASASGGSPGRPLPSPGSVYMLDVARDGRWLVARSDSQLSIRGRLSADSAEREFAWLGAAVRPHIAPDGTFLLFEDESQSAGKNYAVSVRKTDGSPAVRLGEGAAMALSPDGKQVLAQVFDPPEIIVYPIGPGEPIRLKAGPVQRAVPRQWMPDGKRVIVCGSEASRPFRCYEQDLVGGLPRPLMPEGLDAGPVSPDGSRVVAIAADRSQQIYSFVSRTSSALPTLKADEIVVAWAVDGRSVFVVPAADIPAPLDRIDVETGRRTRVRELAPPDRAGVTSIFFVDVRDDGASYAYSYAKALSKLFVVKGVSPKP
jgi:eukaryotic-like serine/threonine-protein kinase